MLNHFPGPSASLAGVCNLELVQWPWEGKLYQREHEIETAALQMSKDLNTIFMELETVSSLEATGQSTAAVTRATCFRISKRLTASLSSWCP